MNGLIPKEKQLYLPYSQRTVSVVYFDASEVITSLLSCPTLNKYECLLFDDAKNPFVAPSGRLSHAGDISTGRCYRKTYKALVKNKGVDIILSSILAMDKTHINMAGRLLMEPITISHGLLKHTVRRQAIAMRILGYINHSAPAHLPALSELDTEFNAPSGLPLGTVVVEAPLRRIKNVAWPTYLLNELHIQIQFILEESGFLRLQRKGFRWDLHYNTKIYPIVFHPFVPFIIGDTEGHNRRCGHYTAQFSKIQQLCPICECPTYLTGYSKSNFPHRLPKGINKLVRNGETIRLKLPSQSYLKNGFDDVRFGKHNQLGIFGACPGEILHLISLGWFKYCLEAFAAQAGKGSEEPGATATGYLFGPNTEALGRVMHIKVRRIPKVDTHVDGIPDALAALVFLTSPPPPQAVDPSSSSAPRSSAVSRPGRSRTPCSPPEAISSLSSVSHTPSIGSTGSKPESPSMSLTTEYTCGKQRLPRVAKSTTKPRRTPSGTLPSCLPCC